MGKKCSARIIKPSDLGAEQGGGIAVPYGSMFARLHRSIHSGKCHKHDHAYQMYSIWTVIKTST